MPNNIVGEPVNWLQILSRFANIFEPQKNPFEIETPIMNSAPPPQPNIDFGVPAPDFTNLPSTPQQPVTPELTEDQLVSQWMKELYNPSYDMQRKFEELVNQFPQRNNPSGLRKLGAYFAGIGSQNPVAATEQFLYAPYQRDLADWKERVAPISRAADIERNANVNERIAAEQTVQRKLQANRDAEAQRKNLAKEDLENRKLEVRREYQNILAIREARPEFKSFTDETDGYVYLINMRNPSEIHKTPILGKELSETEKLAIQHANAKELAQIRGSIESRHIAERTAGAKEVATIRESTPTSQANVELAQRRQRKNRASEFVNTHPLGKWVKLYAGEDFEVMPVGKPGTFGFGGVEGPTAEEREEIIKFIYGPNSPAGATDEKSGTTVKDTGINVNQTNAALRAKAIAEIDRLNEERKQKGEKPFAKSEANIQNIMKQLSGGK